MSEYDREIVESIRKAAGTDLKDELRIIQATVTKVYAPQSYTCDCTPINGDSTAPFLGVSLSANANDGFVLIPAIKSTVLIAESTKNNPPFIIGCDTLQGIICVVHNASGNASQLLVGTAYTSAGETQPTLQFNDGSYGGLIQIQELITRLNTIENDINTLKTAFSTWVVAPNDGGSALKASAATWYGDTLSLSNRNDIENTAVTHGK